MTRRENGVMEEFDLGHGGVDDDDDRSEPGGMEFSDDEEGDVGPVWSLVNEKDTRRLVGQEAEEVVVEAGNVPETVATALFSANWSPHSGGSTNHQNWQPTLDAEIDETLEIKTRFPGILP